MRSKSREVNLLESREWALESLQDRNCRGHIYYMNEWDEVGLSLRARVKIIHFFQKQKHKVDKICDFFFFFTLLPNIPTTPNVITINSRARKVNLRERI